MTEDYTFKLVKRLRARWSKIRYEAANKIEEQAREIRALRETLGYVRYLVLHEVDKALEDETK